MNALKVKSLIGKELWSETKTSSVLREDFLNVQKAINKLKTAEEKADFKELCKEEVSENQNAPIIPRFLLSVFGKHPIEDLYISSVFDEYYRDNMWPEVEFIAEIILTFNESSYIYKSLAECYELNGEIEKKISVWKRLVKIDLTETKVFYDLADYYLEKGDKDSALLCYKRVIQRHINALDLKALKDIWPKVLEMEQDADYLVQVSSKIAKVLGNDKGVFFLTEILNKSTLDTNSKIKILKKILDFSNNNKEATDKIIVELKEKYKDNPRLEYCLENTGLLNNYLDSNIAVANFEKEIEFVEGAFVYHNSWHLGRIKKIDKDEMYIQFLSKKELHKMSCNMAFDSLKILPKQHILVLKAGAKPEVIKSHLMENTEWGIRMLLNSYPEGITMKQMKAELVPSILSPREWTSWWSVAKNELYSNPYFGTSDISNDVYILRDTPISFEEKTLGIFVREKDFFSKYDILKDFLKKNGNTDSEEFGRIIDYFESELSASGYAGVCSYLILNDYKNRAGLSFIKLDVSFEEIYGNLSLQDVKQIYNDIQDNDLKRWFIDKIIETESPSKLNKVLVALLHQNPNSYIYEKLSKRTVDNLRREAIDNYQTDTDFILYLLKESTDEEWNNAGIEKEDLIILKLQLLLFVNGKVSHSVDSAANKDKSKKLIDMLFTNGELTDYLTSCDTESAKRIYSYIENIPLLEEERLIGIKHFILSNRKDANDIVSVQKFDLTNERMIPKGFLCTKALFDVKTKELDHLMNVEIPENSRQIGIAREMGDLRENAEYQYAKDRQKNLNFLMNKLNDEIDSARIISPESVNTEYVEFGTTVTFKDNIAGGTVVYTLLGAWESNPDKNILNFQAPLGQKIYNMQLGENKKFVINDIKYDYTVEKIELADFNL